MPAFVEAAEGVDAIKAIDVKKLQYLLKPL